MARQSDKSYYLKRLFDHTMVRTSPESPPNVRQDQAAKLMDELVGPRWRTEVNAEMELIPDLAEIPTSQEVEEFWGGVQQAGYAAGFGTEEVTHDEPQDTPEPVCQKDPKILLAIKQLLGY